MTFCFLATLTNIYVSEDILDKFWPHTPLQSVPKVCSSNLMHCNF